MYSLLMLALSSFALSLILTGVVRNAFLRLGVLDKPDNVRKLHKEAIPRVGGIPIAISYVAAYAILLLSPLNAATIIQAHMSLVWKLLPAISLIFATGLIDDLIGLKPWQKLTGQFIAAGWACWAGVCIVGPAGHTVEHWWSVPLTLLWLIGCTNAFNLIDGIDGLASGVGLFATVTILLAALLQNNVPLALATVPLAGCLLGFLRYNFNPASIFLGDSGSLLIGFLLGCYGVIWSQESATLLGMTAPLMALAVPILDTGLSIIRRFLRHQPIFGADRGHIHHRLLDQGLTPRRAALMLYGICGLAAAFSLIQSVADNQMGGLIIVLFCMVTWIGVQHLGYVEFSMARRLLVGGAFRRMLDAQLSLRSFEESVKAATNLEDCWLIIRKGCRSFGFSQVQLNVTGRAHYVEQIDNANPEECWNLNVPLLNSNSVSLTRALESPVLPMVVAPFVDVLSRALNTKLRELEAGGPASTQLVMSPRYKALAQKPVSRFQDEEKMLPAQHSL